MCVYIDFRKAFDSIWRKGLWNVMRHLGYPEKIVKILENAYKNTFSAVRVDGDISDWFETIVGVLQGCVLSPLLFSIFLEMVFALGLDDSSIGAVINGVKMGNLRFADDIAVLAEEELELQRFSRQNCSRQWQNGYADQCGENRNTVPRKRQ